MKIKVLLPPISLAAGILVIWQVLCVVLNVPQYILPKPTTIMVELYNEIDSLSLNAAITIWEAFLGFSIANIVAISLAATMAFVRYLDKAVMPIAIALKTTPIVAMAPLLLLWFGTGIAPKVAAAALICFFPALVNTIKGLNALEVNEMDLFRIYGANKWKILWKLQFNRAAPYIFSALRVSSSLAIVGAIIGEFVGANQGIGYIILISSYHLETVTMFAALVTAAGAGILFYSLIAMWDKHEVKWVERMSDEAHLEGLHSSNRK